MVAATRARLCQYAFMRTTVDLPDDLYRQAKAQAALAGVHLRDLVEEGLRTVLGGLPKAESPRRVVFPLHHSRNPGVLSVKDVRKAETEAERRHEDVGRGRHSVT